MLRHILVNRIVGEARKCISSGINLNFRLVRFAEPDHPVRNLLKLRKRKSRAVFSLSGRAQRSLRLRLSALRPPSARRTRFSLPAFHFWVLVATWRTPLRLLYSEISTATLRVRSPSFALAGLCRSWACPTKSNARESISHRSYS